MKLYLLAGEPSGDKLGAALIRGLGSLVQDLEIRGVAGLEMQAEGMASLFPMDELSVMGIAEVLPKYLKLRRRLNEVVADCVAWRPDALITIDVPDFSQRMACAVRKRLPGMRSIHYVAPSVWAWRAWRAERMARCTDHVLALLPFEPPYMTRAGMTCDFVGHPVVSEPLASPEDVRAFRAETGSGDAPILLALPGSRPKEVARLVPVFGEAMRRVMASRPDVRIVVPAAGPVASAVREGVGAWPGEPIVLDPRDGAPAKKRAAFAAADAALAASGTVSLELAANATPMVVAYDMNWLSWQVMSRLATIDTVTLVNLVTNTRTVPEFLGPGCKPAAIAAAVNELLSGHAACEAQLDAMAMTMTRLGRGGEAPGLRAARSVLAAISRSEDGRGE
ncbi:MAG: lipid-A-disaccharide synthase [Boseongicola sp. SB0677_bin_26]|nr:lipid-A-disaccharide synthase [Boseongicola sp. SB0665_bin_10]MYG26637.1 lipid-A-disaccharide synthase [Boseongicola sp. SB0677_bin_26]